jgi:hypothetical protein
MTFPLNPRDEVALQVLKRLIRPDMPVAHHADPKWQAEASRTAFDLAEAFMKERRARDR